MDRTDLVKEILSEYNDGSDWDIRDKIGSVALVVMAVELSPSETEWREFLLVSGIDIYDSEVSEHCVNATNLYHYSGLITLSEYEDDTWVNASSPHAFNGVTDGEFATMISRLKVEVKEIRKSLGDILPI